ncbi:MAG: TfoX/Sxy family protein [Nitrospirales bacterium]
MVEGWSSLKEELIFGLVADEVLYLKVGQATTPDYEELGLGPFV